MKKIYNSPAIRVAELDNQAIIAASPSIAGGPGVSTTSITDDNKDDFQADSRDGSLWDSEW